MRAAWCVATREPGADGDFSGEIENWACGSAPLGAAGLNPEAETQKTNG